MTIESEVARHQVAITIEGGVLVAESPGFRRILREMSDLDALLLEKTHQLGEPPEILASGAIDDPEPYTNRREVVAMCREIANA